MEVLRYGLAKNYEGYKLVMNHKGNCIKNIQGEIEIPGKEEVDRFIRDIKQESKTNALVHARFNQIKALNPKLTQEVLQEPRMP